MSTTDPAAVSAAHPVVAWSKTRCPYEIRVNGQLVGRAITEGDARRFASRFTQATAEVYRNGELIAEYGGRGPRESA